MSSVGEKPGGKRGSTSYITEFSYGARRKHNQWNETSGNDFRGMWYGDHVMEKKGNKGPSLLRQKFIIYIVCLHLLRFVWCSTISVN